MLNVFDELKDERFVLHIIGNNISRDQTNVHFHKLICPTEYDHFFSDKHFIIKSNTFDSFGIFVLEAMNYNIIPIISYNTGVSELIYQKVNGFIYKNRIQLIELLESIPFFKEFEEMLKKQNLLSVHNWETCTNNYLSEYYKLINSSY
jgi:glycosyltransferase involved in cell wall biosynthesis